ncbi:hypothetical protein N431DRAFT_465602 [Stipitochalara longipes BDJ]|nr:hypothetical protein N431DRAFT_465602 [Stipitochalara longipes BDJ]
MPFSLVQEFSLEDRLAHLEILQKGFQTTILNYVFASGQERNRIKARAAEFELAMDPQIEDLLELLGPTARDFPDISNQWVGLRNEVHTQILDFNLLVISDISVVDNTVVGRDYRYDFHDEDEKKTNRSIARMEMNPNQRYLPYPGDKDKSSVPMPAQYNPLRPVTDSIIRSKTTDNIHMDLDPSLRKQNHETTVQAVEPGQETLPYNNSVPGATISSVHRSTRPMHPPSLVPGFQPKIKTHQEGLRPNILRKPPAEGFLRSRSGVQPGGSYQLPPMPGYQPRGTGTRLSATPESRTSQNFSKPIQKARVPLAMVKDFHSAKKENSTTAENLALPKNTLGLGTSFNIIRNAISPFGESFSSVTPAHTPETRLNEGVVHLLEETSQGGPNMSSPGPCSQSTKGVPDCGTTVSSGHEILLLGSTEQTFADQKFRDQGSNYANISSPMPQRSKPQVLTDNAPSRGLNPALGSTKPGAARNEAQNPYESSSLMPNRYSLTKGTPNQRQKPHTDPVTIHKSSNPRDQRQRLEPVTSRVLHNEKQDSSLSRSFRGNSNIGSSPKASREPVRNTGNRPVQTPQRRPIHHPSKSFRRHPAENLQPHYTNHFIKHGGGHRAETPHGHPQRPEHLADNLPEPFDERPAKYGYPTDEDYPDEQLRNNETPEPFYEKSTSYDCEADPDFFDQYSRTDAESLVAESLNALPYNHSDLLYEEPFEEFPRSSNNLPTEPGYTGSFPSQDSSGDEQLNASHDGYSCEDVPSFTGRCDPFLSENLENESRSQDSFNCTESPSLPRYPSDQSAAAEENADNGWQSQGDQEWPPRYLPQGQYGHLDDESGTFYSHLSKYKPINYENETRWEDRPTGQQGKIQDEDIVLGLDCYTEHEYVDKYGNAQKLPGGTNLGSDIPVLGEPELRPLKRDGGENAAWGSCETDGIHSEDGVGRTFREENDLNDCVGDDNEDSHSYAEAELENDN